MFLIDADVLPALSRRQHDANVEAWFSFAEIAKRERNELYKVAERRKAD